MNTQNNIKFHLYNEGYERIFLINLAARLRERTKGGSEKFLIFIKLIIYGMN